MPGRSPATMGGMPELSALIDRDFDRGTIDRGLAYWRNGYVGELREGQGPTHVEVIVSGSEDYEVQIQWSGLNVGRDGISVDEVSGECTCPIGWRCKHVVAALAEWAARLGFPPNARRRQAPAARRAQRNEVEVEPFPELDHLAARKWHDVNADAQRWSDDLRGRAYEEARARVGELFFVLAARGSRLALDVVGGRRLKSGAMGVGKRFGHIRQVGSRAGRDYATEDDVDLIAMLLPFAGEYDGDKLLRRPPAFLIEHLLATGRCHWLDFHNTPLRLLEPVPAHLRWVERDGRRRIEIHDSQGQALDLVDTDPPLRRTGSGLGPIATDAPRARLRAIVDMPWLSAPLIRASAGSLPLPPPESLGAPVAPRPRLRLARRALTWVAMDGERRRAADVGVVTFLYGADELGVDGFAVIAGADGAPVTRDLVGERERLAELARLGVRRWPPPGTQVAGDAAMLRDQPLHLLIERMVAPGADPVAIPPAVLVALRGSGWDIVGADGVPEATLIELGEISARVDDRDGGDWFEVQLGIEVDGRRIDLVPLLTPLLRGGPEAWSRLPRAAGEPPAVLATCGDTSVLRVPLALIETLHAQLIELFDQPPGPGGGWRIDAARADLIGALDHLSPRWIGGERLRRLADRLRSCLAPPTVAVPAGLTVELRPYQRDGLAWLQHLAGLGLGGVLADDMGLGKTVQAIAHLMVERDAGRADRARLVICPASVVQVWRDQVARHAP
ncbi:MAG: SWIM zinc finger family protein, partial [Planctomycetes bacterium]|nr:SWIM zinc finger family protein [Planctomycetota bacterium]